jgi:hypothetical protein
VHTVYVDGEAILDEGTFTRFDATEAARQLDAKALSWAKEIGAQRGTWPIKH